MPYLVYDENPYMVITDDGKQMWVIDAYTVTDCYPYSQKTLAKIGDNKKDINHIDYSGHTPSQLIEQSYGEKIEEILKKFAL